MLFWPLVSLGAQPPFLTALAPGNEAIMKSISRHGEYRSGQFHQACITLDGQIHFWDPIDGVVMYTIEGRRDIAVGRLRTDGSFGSSKYICMYDIADQFSEDGPGEEPSGDDMLSSFNEWSLPAKEFNGMWESLIYETGLKQRLLRYAASALLFTEKGVDSCLVSWNRKLKHTLSGEWELEVIYQSDVLLMT